MRAAGHEVWTMNPHENDAGTETWLKEVVAIGEREAVDVVWAGAYGTGTEALARFLDKINVNPGHEATKGPGSTVLRKVNRILPFARMVTASTPHLVDHYMGEGVVVKHCPNFCDPTYFEKVQTPRLFERDDACLRVAFVYNHNRHGDYYPLLPMLRDLAKRGSIHLVTFGGFPEEFWGQIDPAHVGNISKRPMSEFHYMLHQVAPDVVLNRLEPSEFNLAKSNIKWIEATMAGAVTVASAWGEMMSIPDGGGLLIPAGPEVDIADELGFWGAQLDFLVKLKRETPEALDAMVDISRQEVAEKWSTASAGQLWLEPLNALGAQTPPA
jgi:hypothetical protein